MTDCWGGGGGVGSLLAQSVKSACRTGYLGSIPGSGGSSREGDGNPLQYSWGFPGGLGGKESAHNVGEPGSMPMSGSFLEFPWSITGWNLNPER